MKTVLLVVTATLALVIGAAPVQADVHWADYRLKATKVAKKIHCRDPHHKEGPNSVEFSAVRCDLGRRGVTVITFTSKRQQNRFYGALQGVSGAQFVAAVKGIIIIGRNGGSAAAEAGATALKSDVLVF